MKEKQKLKLSEFDILGIISLNDVQGIEKYVTPVIEDGKVVEYLSRSKEYYNVKSMTELALERENLAQLLTNQPTKRNFVIAENMLNCSGKVYFRKFENYIHSGKTDIAKTQLTQAEECMMEDVRNLLAIFQDQENIQVDPNNRLPAGYENSQKRFIEMDNKAILYIFTKALKLKKQPNEVEVLTPGYGGIYIGPFLKAMHGYQFTNTLKSKYIEETQSLQDCNISSLMSSSRPFEKGKTILLLDDNIGTGVTMQEIKTSLMQEGITDTISGAIQYNWRNYYRTSVGQKTDINRFNVQSFDILTPINYAGHKLYEHAIDILNVSGDEYINYLKARSYRKAHISDIEGALFRGITCADACGLKLIDGVKDYIVPMSLLDETADILPEYQDGPTEISNPIQKEMVKRIADIIKNMHKSKDVPNAEQCTIKSTDQGNLANSDNDQWQH